MTERMDTDMYIPNPVGSDSEPLPAGLYALAEAMARNVHDVWMRGRIAQGWVYGPQRDDEKKTHPCIVPYDQLSETEKDYDRRTSQETLRFILRQGYKIEKV